jgi:hypothetical protein
MHKCQDMNKIVHKIPQEKEMIQRDVEWTDGAIDRKVYELYGLTEEDIKIVEGSPLPSSPKIKNRFLGRGM